MPRPVWLRTDDATEGVYALELATEQLQSVLAQSYRWKWVLVALHNSLQAFMAAALRGSAGIGAMRNDYIDQWHEAYERGEQPTMDPTIASFNTLWARVQSPKWIRGFIHSKPVAPTAEQVAAVERTKEWRDIFIHYSRASLSIECGGYPDFARGDLEVIDAIAFQTGHVFMEPSELGTRTRRSLDEGHRILDAIDAAYGP